MTTRTDYATSPDGTDHRDGIEQERDALRAELDATKAALEAAHAQVAELNGEVAEALGTLNASTALCKAAEKVHEEDQAFIEDLGHVCCGVAFTTGQYEAYNERMQTTAECAYCRKPGPRTPEAMTAHAVHCKLHPLSAATLRAETAERGQAALRAFVEAVAEYDEYIDDDETYANLNGILTRYEERARATLVALASPAPAPAGEVKADATPVCATCDGAGVVTTAPQPIDWPIGGCTMRISKDCPACGGSGTGGAT